LFPLLDDCQRRRNRAKQETGIRQQCSNDFHKDPPDVGRDSESTAWGDHIKRCPTRRLTAQRNSPSITLGLFRCGWRGQHHPAFGITVDGNTRDQ
jgi:hypothetical protein